MEICCHFSICVNTKVRTMLLLDTVSYGQPPCHPILMWVKSRVIFNGILDYYKKMSRQRF